MIEETAVVRNTMAETRIKSFRYSADGAAVDGAPALAVWRSVWISRQRSAA